jgi:D-arabinose 1-dehydrogenase-like Zn-dependent alcohol dehydrogenase
VVEAFGGPLVAKEIPQPQPGPAEVLLKVEACAVDQFDLTIRDGKFPTAEVPIILGHEIAGTVVEVGDQVSTFSPGDRVTSTLYLTCGRCRHCQNGRETICENLLGYVGIHTPGGYAEFTTVPAVNLVPLPDHVPFPEASLIANVIGTPYHALRKRVQLQAGERILITGAGGGVGTHAVQLARLMGAFVLAVDLGAEKLAAARKAGADLAVDPTEQDFAEVAMEWTDGLGVDAVLELVGPATMPTSLQAMGKGSRMVIVGSHTGTELTLSPQAMIRNEWEVKGSRNVTKRELAEVVDLVASGRLTANVAGTYPLEHAEDLHHQLRANQIVGRAVLIP